MTPLKVSSFLRSVADRINASKHPSNTLVAQELRHILTAMDDDLISDLNLVKKGNIEVREYEPVGPDSPYSIIDGLFEFTLPNGQTCIFDGRMDRDNVDGKMMCDGENISDTFFTGDTDTPSLSLIDESLDMDLESVLLHLMGKMRR